MPEKETSSINLIREYFAKHEISLFSLALVLFVVSSITKYMDAELYPDIISIGLSTAKGIAIFSTISFILRNSFDWFFHKYVDPHIKTYVLTVKESTTKATEDIKSGLTKLSSELAIHQKDSKELLNQNVLTSIISRSEPDYLKNAFFLFHENAYGPHCGKTEGLYGHLNKEFYKYFKPETPHRSQHNQSLVITEVGEDVFWHEITRFEIHSIAFDNDYNHGKMNNAIESIDHELRYGMSGKFKDLSKINLEIGINKDEPIILHDLLEINGGDVTVKEGSEDKLTVNKVGNHIDFNFHIKIELKTPKTKVYIIENSILHEDENSYIIKRIEPTYGSCINVSLPPSWTINEFIVTDEDKFGEPNRSVVQNIRNADINDWVLPGIAVACYWTRGKR